MTHAAWELPALKLFKATFTPETVAVPANAVAAPVVAPLLWLAFLTAGLAQIAPGIAVAVAQLNGWCAAYLAGCARLFGSLPGAQIRSGRALLAVLVLAAAGGAYAWRRWQSSPRPT